MPAGHPYPEILGLPATGLKTEVLAEERHHVIVK